MLTARDQQNPHPAYTQEVVTTPAEREAMTLDPQGLPYNERPTDLSAFFYPAG
jgi:hypothetical protein